MSYKENGKINRVHSIANGSFFISVSINIVFFFLSIFWVNKNWFKFHRYFDMSSEISIVMFGDSLTSLGDWNSLLGRNDVLNSGNPALTTSHLVNRVGRQVTDYGPKICYILGGINDIGVGIPMNRSTVNIERIVDSLKNHHITVVLQSVIFTNDAATNISVRSMNMCLQQIARKKGVDYLNLNTSLSKGGSIIGAYTTDGVHLSQRGYNVWRVLILEDLKSKKI